MLRFPNQEVVWDQLVIETEGLREFAKAKQSKPGLGKSFLCTGLSLEVSQTCFD